MADKVLVINSGSSSLKFKLFSQAGRALTAVVSGVVERIGEASQSRLSAATHGHQGTTRKDNFKAEIGSHSAALNHVLHYIREAFSQNVGEELRAVGHRVVHGKDYSSAKLVTPQVEAAISEAAVFAPLHNPPNLQGIRAAAEIFPSCPQVAVFDTAFHVSSMPPRAYLYALPWELYEHDRIRRYGAHGTSYKYLVHRAAAVLGREASSLNLIVAHVGAGASMAAIERGRTLDTSMGLTPLEGLMMGTRCGDVDPAIVVHLAQAKGLEPDEIDRLLNRHSGFLGLAGQTDLRSVLADADRGGERAAYAIEVFVHRLRKYIGAYLVHLKGQVDAFVWSAGIGENSAVIRKLAMADLEAFGIKMDEAANQQSIGKEGIISSEDSAIKVLVIPTDEELSIAQQTLEVISEQRQS